MAATLPPFEELDTAIETARKQTLSCLPAFAHKFKVDTSEHNFYRPEENGSWTSGMWTGELNLMYELTGDRLFLDTAQGQVEDFHRRIVQQIDVDNHDMGFLYTPSCVAAYKLTGNEEAKTAALLAADNLCSRFHENGRFIQAHGALDDPTDSTFIIDCLLNLPLLFWASETTGNPSYRKVAEQHFDTAIGCLLRPDNSTYHCYYVDPKTGVPSYGIAGQGYDKNSAWSRGQSWGIYGTALYYSYTHDERAKDAFDRTLSFFLDHLPESGIPFWDLTLPDETGEPWDASALAITICGMQEMARHVGEQESRQLRDRSSRFLGNLWDRCAAKNPAESNGQLLHTVYCRKSPVNDRNDRGVDECSVWGDYFYVEALLRMKNPQWVRYW